MSSSRTPVIGVFSFLFTPQTILAIPVSLNLPGLQISNQSNIQLLHFEQVVGQRTGEIISQFPSSSLETVNIANFATFDVSSPDNNFLVITFYVPPPVDASLVTSSGQGDPPLVWGRPTQMETRPDILRDSLWTWGRSPILTLTAAIQHLREDINLIGPWTTVALIAIHAQTLTGRQNPETELQYIFTDFLSSTPSDSVDGCGYWSRHET